MEKIGGPDNIQVPNFNWVGKIAFKKVIYFPLHGVIIST
jgi:hypothetical protein